MLFFHTSVYLPPFTILLTMYIYLWLRLVGEVSNPAFRLGTSFGPYLRAKLPGPTTAQYRLLPCP
jgi:hypothetical protein